MNNETLRTVTFIISCLVAMEFSLSHAWTKVVTVQVPGNISYVNGTNGGAGALYNFILLDQATPPNPMGNAKVTKIDEVVATRYVTYTNASGTVVGTDVFNTPGSYAWGGVTGSGGQFADFVHLTPLGQGAANSYAASPGNGNICHVNYSPFSHQYTDAVYQGSTYNFSSPITQTQSFIITSTYNTGSQTFSFSTTNITPP